MAEAITPSEISSDSATGALPAYFGASLTTRLEWSQGLPAAAMAGLIAALLTMTPLDGFGMLIGGGLAVVFYRRRMPVARVTSGMGARLGLVSGILGGCIFAGLVSIVVAFDGGDRIREKLIEGMQQAADRNPNPQAHQLMEFFKSPPGAVPLLTMALIGTLIAFVIFSGLGGALGAALLRRKERL